MPSLAQAALGASIVLSALGAVVLCLITVAFGFTPPGEEPPERATRRQFLTRGGHALAAACFAGTAILIAVALAQPARVPVPAADGPADASRLDALVERLHGVEERMKDSEWTLERLEAEVSEVAQAQQAAAVSAPPAAPANAVMPAPAPARTVERPRAAATPGERPRPAERPRGARPAEPAPVEQPRAAAPATTPAPVPPLPTPATAPAVERKAVERPPLAATPPSAERSTSGAALPGPAADAPSAAPAAPPTATTPPAKVAEPPAVSGGRSAGSAGLRPREAPDKPATDFLSRLREDWRAIQRGVESGGEDFRRAVERLRRGGD